MRHIILAIVSIFAASIALWNLNSARDGVDIVHENVGATPIVVFKPVTTAPAPVIVIAHGFAGSQQLMQPFALTMARNGYVAVTFDFMGHGRNPTPLPGGLSDQDASLHALLGQLDEVVSHARKFSVGDGRLALLGHSMATDIVIRVAQKHSDIQATIAVSAFSPVATATSPQNLLIIDGALEPSFLQDEGRRIVGLSGTAPAQDGITYGDFAQGTARRLVLAKGVEHIGVLYSGDSMRAALTWMNEAFSRKGSGFIDARGYWLGLLYLGLVLLAWPLTRLLPVVSRAERDRDMGWRHIFPIAVAPALLTPLILWQLPVRFLPLLLGDYLVLHFSLYGILTYVGVWLSRRRYVEPATSQRSYAPRALASVACIAYGVFAIGVPADRFVSNLMPIPSRLPLMAIMLVGTLTYFVADAQITRAATSLRGVFVFTKVCFLASLAFAIALNPQKLFFLVIIIPAILVLFVVYGLLGYWATRRTNDPIPGALMAAVAFAWAIATTFPIVGT